MSVPIEVCQGLIVGDDYSGKSYTFYTPRNGEKEGYISAGNAPVTMLGSPTLKVSRENIRDELGGR